MRSKNEQTLNNILKLINDCYFESGVYPTFQQIATAVGLSVPQTYRYVDEADKAFHPILLHNRVCKESRNIRRIRCIRVLWHIQAHCVFLQIP